MVDRFLIRRPPPYKVVVEAVETSTERDGAVEQAIGIFRLEKLQSL